MGSPGLPHPQSHSRSQRKPHLRLPVPVSIFFIIGIVLFAQFTVIPRLVKEPSPNALKLSQIQLDRLDAGLQKCTEFQKPPLQYEFPVSYSRANPRWNPVRGQNKTIILRNATLFDGESFVGTVDIKFNKGVVISVSPATTAKLGPQDAIVIDLSGDYVTPGLIDMHSHHLVGSWPQIRANSDTNEMNEATGPLTPFVRSKDSMKADDPATAIIASGGITSSLILPGSANIMGGEGYMVKNTILSGPHGEEVIEELLLEHGIPEADRRRYMKMACGENPKRVYEHTRMGNAWVFRHHMERVKELVEKQDAWCISATVARETGDAAAIAALVTSSSTTKGGLPEELELESSVGMLRGKVGINIHCYEPEDIEDMLLHSKEFNFRIQAFHHALSAWKIPGLIKESGENITVATFSTFGLYKKEGYDANLWAGKILADNGVPIAYKSDHGDPQLNAKYLIFQAATAHSFHLPEDLALQSVTSVPAKSLELDHRIGFVKPGYDADIVVWDSHPLSIGATPSQVYIDGRATLDSIKVAESFAKMLVGGQNTRAEPRMRTKVAANIKEDVCRKVELGKTVITGITKSYLHPMDQAAFVSENLTMVLKAGKVVCFDSASNCLSQSDGGSVLNIEDGHVLPGLTAVSTSLGLIEIAMEGDTGDGAVSITSSPLDPENIVFAKYGIHLDGKAFERAKIAGITQAISAPVGSGFLKGVSVGFKTYGNKNILDGGVFQDDVALHLVVGQSSKKSVYTPTISSAIAELRKILLSNKEKDNIYGRAINGSLPLVVHTENKYDIMQLIKIKNEFRSINLVILGGSEAPAVATELAAAKIPLILTANRPAPSTWETLDVLVGPPLTRSPASVLSEAGVKFGIALGGNEGDSFIHDLPLEAAWAAKYAGLSDHAAVDLVSRNIEEILRLGIKEESRDFVVFEGNPLEFGASVVVAVNGEDRRVMACWPESS